MCISVKQKNKLNLYLFVNLKTIFNMKYFSKNENTPPLFIFGLFIIVVSVACHWHIFNRELAGIHVWRQSQTELNVLNFYRHDSTQRSHHLNFCSDRENDFLNAMPCRVRPAL